MFICLVRHLYILYIFPQQEEVDISKYDKELVIKARFIIRGMMNNGSRKCIVYLQLGKNV